MAYEVFNDSLYQTGTTRGDQSPLVILVQPQLTKRKSPKVGHRLKDVIKEISADQDQLAELAEARRWVASSIYENEHQSLQALRLKLGLSQSELASLADTTQARISKIETGEELPRYDTMKRIGNALGVDMNTLGAALDYAKSRNSRTS